MIEDLKLASEAVGITAFITNSDAKIETQLNRITDHADLPILLISWDIAHSLEFDSNGFIKNPTVNITCLLMNKAETTEKEMREAMAEEMGLLFQQFLQELYPIIVSYQTDNTTPAITGAGYTLVPMYGFGKHSGVLGSFTMKIRNSKKC